MKFLFWILSIALLSSSCSALAGREPLSVAFYNVENLYDTINDPGVLDADFSPSGEKRWTTEKYLSKLDVVAAVLASIGADLVGLAEVENHRVLEELIRRPAIAHLAYEYVHYDSPDRRGMDVALLYRPSRFRIASSRPIPTGRRPTAPSRDILSVSGLWVGQNVELLVCHLPSNLSSDRQRRSVAVRLGEIMDSLRQTDPEKRIFLLGDFNCNPGSAVYRRMFARAGEWLYNPFEKLFRQGYGTYRYRDRWNMYDMILIGEPRLPCSTGEESGPVGKHPPNKPERPVRRQSFTGEVFRRNYLFQKEGEYAGYPFRTYSGNRYLGGISDHLPVVVHWNP